MRIQQGYISESVKSFKNNLFTKYGLSDYCDTSAPLVMFGMYRPNDFTTYLKHEGKIIVVWCGSDGMYLKNNTADIIKSRNAIHYTMGGFISEDLKKFDIPHEIKTITPTKVNITTRPRGNKIYSYGTNEPQFYNLDIAKKIADQLKLEFVFTKITDYKFEDLVKIYEQCFINLRLTKHDGLACSVLEMGLMGRVSVFNGGAPHAIPWDSEEGILESVLNEYNNRHKDNRHITKAFENYINNDDKWLYL